jgi:hypothetical protein
MKTRYIPNDFDSECNYAPDLIKLDLQYEQIPTNVIAIVESLETNARAEVVFKNIEGLRVLDEGNLMEYWNEKTSSKGWLWEILEGGWLEQEIKNGGTSTLRIESKSIKEYFIAGSAMCLNVLCKSEPIVKIKK